MSSVSEYLEQILVESGGFGRFQIAQFLAIIGSKISITWSLLMMAFAGATPEWWCSWNNVTGTGSADDNISMIKVEEACQITVNGSSQTCPSISFNTDMRTIVSEWQLVCDAKWITATVTSIQMAGLGLSGFLSGQMADTIGRRPIYFGSLVLMSVANVVAGLSASWVMFAVSRFFIGLGCGMYLTVFYNYQIEFTPIKYRPLQIAIPDWSLWAAAFGLFAWILHDWSHLHILTGAVTGAYVFSWWLMPESFRWLVSNGRLKEAELVIKRIATFNKKPVPNLHRLASIVANDVSLVNDKKYTYFDLFRNRSTLKRTVLAAAGWLSCGYCYYAISYGVEQLTGNIYINMFLLSVVDIPALMATMFLNNRFGRRWTCFSFFIIGSIATFSVGISQVLDIDESIQGRMINGFALAAKLGVSAAWGALMTFTTEIYPTVVRNLGYGIQNSVSRIGAVIAPHIVLISKDVTGLMYFLSSAFMLLSGICCLLLPETKGRTIEDTFSSAACNQDELESDNGFLPKTSLEKDEDCCL